MNSFVDLEALLAASRAACGTVYLVGAGPGDPELLTLRAARLLAQADVVVYDHLVGPDVLGLVGAQAQRIYVGKERNCHTLAQGDINALLARLAREHDCVVRLKGGDPFVFGRGGEELEVLAAHGVPFEVVPGITAGCGVAAYAGIPLTHRDWTQGAIFVTGHGKDDTSTPDWATLAKLDMTLVIYMGIARCAAIQQALLAGGKEASTPVAVIHAATSNQQAQLITTLGELPEALRASGIGSPGIIVVGDVVRCAGQTISHRSQPTPSRAAS